MQKSRWLLFLASYCNKVHIYWLYIICSLMIDEEQTGQTL